MEKGNLSIRKVKESIWESLFHTCTDIFQFSLGLSCQATTFLCCHILGCQAIHSKVGNVFPRMMWGFPQHDTSSFCKWATEVLESLGRNLSIHSFCLWAMNTESFQTIRDVLFFPWGGFCFNSQNCDSAHGCAGRAGHLPPQQAAPVHAHTEQGMCAELPGEAESSSTGVCAASNLLSHPALGWALRGSTLQGTRR